MTRVALLGFHLESNAFAPVSEERHFRSLCYFEGEDIVREARKEAPALPAEMPGFFREMDALGKWTQVTIVVTACEAGGSGDDGLFQATLAEMRQRLRAGTRLDAVYVRHQGGMEC